MVNNNDSSDDSEKLWKIVNNETEMMSSEIQRNTMKCREKQRKAEKCREMQRNG